MNDVTISDLILTNLITNEPFIRDTIPYIDSEYFETKVDQALFSTIRGYFEKSNSLINRNILMIEINEAVGLNSEELKEAKQKIDFMCHTDPQKDISWLTKETEE